MQSLWDILPVALTPPHAHGTALITYQTVSHTLARIDEQHNRLTKSTYGCRRESLHPCIWSDVLRTANLAAAALAVLSSGQAAVTLLPAPDGHFSVPVFVNDSGPYPFILDTAADSSGVYQWFADQAKLPSNGTQTSGSGMTSTIRVPEYRVRTFEMDGHRIRKIVAYALPSRHPSGGLAGILGNDFMDKTVTVFDFPCHRVEILSNPAAASTVAGKGRPPIAAYRVAGETLLSFPIRLNGAEGVAILDTGNRLTKINTRLAQAAGLKLSSGKFHATNARYGVGAVRMVSKQGPLGNIQIGQMTIPAVQGEVIDLPSFKELYGDRPAMIIGVDLLQHFRLIYEHSQNRFWLRSSGCE
jgi:predicted aspartyl protease